MKDGSKNMMTFHFSQKDIRVDVREDGEPMYCGKDIADSLDIAWNGNTTLSSIPDEWKGVLSFDTPRGAQELIFITEPAVYKLAFRSNKPEADRFVNWLCSDVIPAIRKRGFYGQAPFAELRQLRKQLLDVINNLQKTTDAFVRKNLLNVYDDLVVQLGIKPVEHTELGKRVGQQTLPGM